MKSTKMLARFIPMLLLVLMSSSLLAQNITGLNVGYVKEKYRTTVIHIWKQTGKTIWTRTQMGSGQKTKFIEEKRAQDGVTLKLVGNIKQRIKIDIRQKTVFNLSSGAKGTIIETGPSKYGAAVITKNPSKPKAIIKANGQTVTYATFSKNGKPYGSFKQTGPKKWAEYKGNRKDHEFTETRRGPWSVFLTDKNRGISITVNLHTKKVSINNRPEYDVTYADARKVPGGTTNPTSSNIKAKGRTVTYIKFNGNGKPVGSLKQVGPRKWKEYKNGKEFATFSETNRDANSVYMKDAGRNLKLQIDLYTKRVKINGQNYFDITYADTRTVPRAPVNPIVTSGGSTNGSSSRDKNKLYNIRMHIYCAEPGDGNSDAEIFGNLYFQINNKKTYFFNESEDNHKHIYRNKSFVTPTKRFKLDGSSIAFGGHLIEEDTGGDDDLGTERKYMKTTDLLKIVKDKGASPYVIFREGSTKITVYLKVEEYYAPNVISSKRQKYEIGDFKSLIDGKDLYHQKDQDLTGMGNGFYNQTKSTAKYTSWEGMGLAQMQHVQGMAITDRGRLILSHDVNQGEGYFIYSKPNSAYGSKTPFSYTKQPDGSHPSAMQACGDYVIVTAKKTHIYKSTSSGLQRLNHLDFSDGAGAAGLVYSAKDDCYYALLTREVHYSSRGDMTLYKSSSNNLESASCTFTKVNSFTGPASSTGTQLFIQSDGTLFVLAMRTNDSYMSAALITDHIALGKINSDLTSCKLIKSTSNYRGTAPMTSASFRWAGTAYIKNNELYVASPDRTFESTFTIKHYRTRK